MAKTFREWNPEQAWLFPPSVLDLVPEEHPAHFVRDLVRDSLDLSEILVAYGEERGQPPYHPTMMTALLRYAYSRGVYSSRKIARACEERVDFMAVTGMQKPDHDTINEFRRRHLPALKGLFGQVLRVCREAGLARLGHVALDGTKMRANASKHRAMSYKRMREPGSSGPRRSSGRGPGSARASAAALGPGRGIGLGRAGGGGVRPTALVS